MRERSRTVKACILQLGRSGRENQRESERSCPSVPSRMDTQTHLCLITNLFQKTCGLFPNLNFKRDPLLPYLSESCSIRLGVYAREGFPLLLEAAQREADCKVNCYSQEWFNGSRKGTAVPESYLLKVLSPS
jgi:hypothetical protein